MTARRNPYSDLPEFTRYVDRGCAVHPACLTCPLAKCRYDVPPRREMQLATEPASRSVRDAEIIGLRGTITAPEIAERFGLTRRTVFRIFAAARA